MVKLLISHSEQEIVVKFKSGPVIIGRRTLTFEYFFFKIYHIKGFELLQEDLSSLLVENKTRESRQSSRNNRVYPTKRQNQSIPGRNVLIFVYMVAIISVLTWR